MFGVSGGNKDTVGTTEGAAHFLPDSMNLSYSTAILQDRAWRL